MSPAFRASLSPALFASILLLASTADAADVNVTLGAGDGFVIEDNTGAIERLRVDEATGNVSRNGALFVHTTGTNGLFVGANVGNTAITGPDNTAVGANVLVSNTTGQRNSAFGSDALRYNTTAAGAAAFGFMALRQNTSGAVNSAFGSSALRSNTTGSQNSAFGSGTLFFNSTGHSNSGFGQHALYQNSTGTHNSAFGRDALANNQTGGYNSAFGFRALFAGLANTSNTAFGASALSSVTTGDDNVAMGRNAGSSQTTGSNNLYLVNTGVAGESGRIKIGTVGTHTQTTIAGIHSTASSSGIAVLINSSGVLGTNTSSARFKRDVRDMAGASDVLLKLRPVTFHYREEAVGAEEAQATQYGLIAEEVAAVAPELVAPDAEGRPYSVQYHELPALLLNEFQEQQRTIDEQREQISVLSDRLARLEVERRPERRR